MSCGLAEECDVLVVGSGSAGLVAALTSSVAGLATVVLEKTDRIGGTTAQSAAGIWVPANHHAHAAGIADSQEAALDYIRAAAPPGWQDTEDGLWRCFVVEAPEMLAFVERHTPLRFALTPQPDPYPDLPGARAGGRMVSPGPLRRGLVGSYHRRLRRPVLPHVFTYQEALALDPYHHPLTAALRLLPALLRRLLTDARGMGTALVTGLLKGCLDHGCRIESGTRAVAPIVDAGSVRGIVVERQGRRREVRARRGVVLATGGYEWNAELLDRHFPGPRDFICSSCGNEGDGHLIAASAGAELAHMDQANIGSALPMRHGRAEEGLSITFHHEPNAIVVDRSGRRFANEFAFNIGEILDVRDPASNRPLHLPAWVISDAGFPRRSPIFRRFARNDPQWMVRADTVVGLAERIGVPAEALQETIGRYNAACRSGVDAEFHRERTGHRHVGPGAGVGPALVAIERPPFVAMPFNRSFISTKGGPRTNEFGQVLRFDGSVIAGLYCAGVAMANPFGTWAVGAGTTLGPNMTWGYVCAKSLCAGGSLTASTGDARWPAPEPVR